MRFDLSEQQLAFQQTVLDYLEAECPLSRALAPHDTGAADLGIWRGLMDLGIGGILVPEEYGGLGLGLLDLAVIAEPLGRYAAPGPFLEHALATLALVLAGTPDQKDRWLPVLSAGTKRASIALAETKGEWQPSQWSLDDENRLTGTKRHVLHADGADLLIVGLKDGGLGLIEAGAVGLSLSPIVSTDAGRQLAHVAFADTPFERLEGKTAQRVLDAGLVLLAADAFGGAARCVDMSVSYAKEREQFGRPIGTFQAVKHQLADMALMVHPFIGLYWYAAHCFDTTPHHTTPDAAPQAAALAKAHLTGLFPTVTRRMIEAHGGIGYTWEFGAHVWLKRALFDQAYLGMPQFHRARFADMAGW